MAGAVRCEKTGRFQPFHSFAHDRARHFFHGRQFRDPDARPVPNLGQEQGIGGGNADSSAFRTQFAIEAEDEPLKPMRQIRGSLPDQTRPSLFCDRTISRGTQSVKTQPAAWRKALPRLDPVGEIGVEIEMIAGVDWRTAPSKNLELMPAGASTVNANPARIRKRLICVRSPESLVQFANAC